MPEPERKKLRVGEPSPQEKEEPMEAEVLVTPTTKVVTKTSNYCALCDETAETNEAWRNYCFACNCAVMRDSQGYGH